MSPELDPVPSPSPSSTPAASPRGTEHAVTELLATVGPHRVLGERVVHDETGTPMRVLVVERADAAAHAEGRVPVDADVLRETFRLSPREIQVASLLVERCTNEEIATRLGISAHTARHHTERVLQKLRVARRTDVAAVVAQASAPAVAGARVRALP